MTKYLSQGTQHRCCLQLFCLSRTFWTAFLIVVLLPFHTYAFLASFLLCLSSLIKLQCVTGDRTKNVLAYEMEAWPYGVKMEELEVVKDVLKTVFLWETIIFTCKWKQTEGFLFQIYRRGKNRGNHIICQWKRNDSTFKVVSLYIQSNAYLNLTLGMQLDLK